MATSQIKIPERLGKYPITGVAGKGAMGVVFKGMDPVIKRPVAIKTIRKELLDEDDHTATDSLSSRFQREAQAAGALNHPGIVSVYEYGEDANYAYIAMEYVEGSNLRDYMASGTKFDEQDTVSIMAQLLDALNFAHSAAVWHRDIKPANIIVQPDGRLKILDFGLARLQHSTLTANGAVVGSPGYMSPEQAEGKRVDERSDIFSAAAVGYLILSGRAPFGARTLPMALNAILHESPAALSPAEAPEPLARVLFKALEKSPHVRYQTCGTFLADLRRALTRVIRA